MKNPEHTIEVKTHVQTFLYRGYLCQIELHHNRWCGYIILSSYHFLYGMGQKWINHILKHVQPISYAKNGLDTLPGNDSNWVIGFPHPDESPKATKDQKWATKQCMALVDEIAENHENKAKADV